MNATRFTMFGALAASLLMLPACDDKKDEGRTDAAAASKADAKDAQGGVAKAEKAAAEAGGGAEAAAAEAKDGAGEEPAAPADGAEAAAAEAIGVAVCDEYIAKYGACIEERAPEDKREVLRGSLAKTVERYKTQSQGPEKDSLEQTCTAALNAVKQTSKGWGCTYE